MSSSLDPKKEAERGFRLSAEAISSFLKGVYDKAVSGLKPLAGGQSSSDPSDSTPNDPETLINPSSQEPSLNIDVFVKKEFNKKDETLDPDPSTSLTFHPDNPEKRISEKAFAKEINEINAQPPIHPKLEP